MIQVVTYFVSDGVRLQVGMLSYRYIVKMAKWARHPPSLKQVIFVFSVIVFCLSLFGYEKVFGWPDALKPNPKTHKAIKITSP